MDSGPVFDTFFECARLHDDVIEASIEADRYVKLGRWLSSEEWYQRRCWWIGEIEQTTIICLVWRGRFAYRLR